MSTTWNLYLEEAPEAFEVIAYDDTGQKYTYFSFIFIKYTLHMIMSYKFNK